MPRKLVLALLLLLSGIAAAATDTHEYSAAQWVKTDRA